MIAAYAELLKEMWEGNERYVSPWQLKGVIGKFASQVFMFIRYSLVGTVNRTRRSC